MNCRTLIFDVVFSKIYKTAVKRSWLLMLKLESRGLARRDCAKNNASSDSRIGEECFPFLPRSE